MVGKEALPWWRLALLGSASRRVLTAIVGGYHSANAARAWAYLTSIMYGSLEVYAPNALLTSHRLDNPLPLDTNIPDHSGFPLYAPSFTLDVPAGNMLDENTEAYLQSVEERYDTIISTLQERLEVRSAP